MDEPRGAMVRRIPHVLVAAVMVVAIAACTPVPSAMSPGETAEPSPQEAPPAEPADEAPPAAAPVDASATPEPGDEVVDDSEVEPQEDLVLGSIELSIESGGVEHVYKYNADHCFVSSEYILAGGTGAEVGTGIASEVGISTSPAELLHESSGTFQADGIISVRTNGNEIVSDGRPITVEGHTIPSVFTYREDGNSAHYVVAWFSGGTDVGAGYVKVNCDY